MQKLPKSHRFKTFISEDFIRLVLGHVLKPEKIPSKFKMQGFDSPRREVSGDRFWSFIATKWNYAEMLIVSSEIVLFLITALWHFCRKVGKTLHLHSSGNILIEIVFECVLYSQ